MARGLWQYSSRAWAEKAWTRWYARAIRSRLEPVKRAARMIKAHLFGVITATVKHVTNASSEAVNARIQWLKKQACGFRSRERFRSAILFQLGNLDMYPEPRQA